MKTYAELSQPELIARLERESAAHYRAYIGLKIRYGITEAAWDHLEMSVNWQAWAAYIARLNHLEFIGWHYETFGADNGNTAYAPVSPIGSETTAVQLSLC